MPRELNGMKKWLVGVATTVAIGWVVWVGSSIITLGSAMAAQQAKQQSFEQFLDRLDKKFDRVLERAQR